MRKDARHRARSEESFGRNALAAARAAEKARPHLLATDAQHDVVDASLDRHPTFAESCRAGGASVRGVDDGNAGLADLAQDALADTARCFEQIAAVERLHVLDRQPAIVERHQRRLRTELRHRTFGETPELDHVRSYDIDVGHRISP